MVVKINMYGHNVLIIKHVIGVNLYNHVYIILYLYCIWLHRTRHKRNVSILLYKSTM